MKRIIRMPTQVHTRKLDRAVAHKRMERAGLRGVNDHTTSTGFKVDSYFSNHWREVANEEMKNM